MKTFVLALVVLILLTGIVTLSACSMVKTTNEMLALLDQLPSAVAGSETEFQRLFKSLQAGPVLQTQKSLYPLALDDGEAVPGLPVVVHGLVHAQLLLNGLKPDPVMGQPVF